MNAPGFKQQMKEARSQIESRTPGPDLKPGLEYAIGIAEGLKQVVEANLQYGPMTEHERGWKNALLMMQQKIEAALRES